MLNTELEPSQHINFSQTLSNGSYFVYLWTVENYVSNYRSFNVKLEGTQVASAIGSLQTIRGEDMALTVLPLVTEASM
jgi:hypothetical protein